MNQLLIIRVFYRISRILLHTLLGLAIAAFVWPFTSKQTRLKLTKWWCRTLLWCFDIRVITFGNLPLAYTQKTMFVANHISWADIHALNSMIPLRFVAKTEIKNWPVFGYLVKKSNTIFVERTKRQQAGLLVEIVKESLLESDNVGFFPEGTTTDGTNLLAFKSSLLQAAVDAGAAIWPVAIRYPNEDGSVNTHMAYAGETTLVQSMKNVLKQKKPTVELHFLPQIKAADKNRRDICQAAHSAIAHKLNL